MVRFDQLVEDKIRLGATEKGETSFVPSLMIW